MSGVLERFLRYVKIDTQSDHNSTSWPSTSKQLDLARLLVSEMEAMGLKDVCLDENGYVMGSLPANVKGSVPKIGWIAHMDTSPSASGTHVNPRLVENYDGGDIVLNAEKGHVLSPAQFPELSHYTGQTLVITDGHTLLGADDKAGVAEILAACEYLIQHPDLPHGAIKVAFTPDEEVTRGADRLDLVKFGADFAYTLDGGEIGELQYENFNAAKAQVTVHGRAVHPGSSKNRMLNSLHVAMEFDSLLPIQEKPTFTEGYEGFYHLDKMAGTVDETHMEYLLRDHDMEKFEAKKSLVQSAVDFLNSKYGTGTVQLTLTDEYKNMKELIKPVWHVIDTARQAMLDVGVTPIVVPIRGGTDGAKLSYRGLPTPNIFTGGHNFHGRYEYIPVESMEKAVQVVLRIIELYATKPSA
jgi:tripeptide aminopeptidase